MRHLILRIFVALALCGSVQAEELLPVALGHKSVVFPVDKTQPPVSIGATLEFIVTSKNKAPKKLGYVTGFVLGQTEDLLFLELRDSHAIRVATYLQEGRIKYRQASLPSPEDIAARIALQNSETPFKLAPSMRRLTFDVSIEAQIAKSWVPGQFLIFPGAEKKVYRTTDEVVFFDLSAIFQTAEETENGQFKVTVLAQPDVATNLLSAELEGRLSINPNQTAHEIVAEKKRCYIIQRRGSDRFSSEIPCTN